MKFVCLGYIGDKKWDHMSAEQQQAMMEECLAYDDELRKDGHFAGGEALQGADSAVTLRFQDGRVVATDGPYAETKEQIGGILLLEAKDRRHAVELMSKHPGVRLGGPFEIRPAAEEIDALIEARLSQKITPCLWFDDQAEQAVNFYTSIFKNSKITNISRYGKAGFEIHGKPEGTVMAVAFELNGQSFTALNGGPIFKFNEAISLQVNCRTQGDIDHYWEKLSDGGDKSAQQCGWLKDKFGVSWQIVPTELSNMMRDGNAAGSQRVMSALLQMKKLDLATLQRAYAQ